MAVLVLLVPSLVNAPLPVLQPFQLDRASSSLAGDRASSSLAGDRASGRLTMQTGARTFRLRGGAKMLGPGTLYSGALSACPIITKSVTSCLLFALSDVVAQRISPLGGFDGKRTWVTALIGLLYFGPALHFYLDFVTWLVPGEGLRATLLKTLVGQLGFGPAVTCVFFAAFLVADHGLAEGLTRWPAKVRQDLLVTWASELCFWPFVDIVCYTLVPLPLIPLGYNVANFFWTIFLSLQASRAVRTDEDSDKEAAMQ